MSIAVSSDNLRKQKTARNGWNEAIRDAKRKIRDLESTIQVFRERMKAGDPWPGDKLKSPDRSRGKVA